MGKEGGGERGRLRGEGLLRESSFGHTTKMAIEARPAGAKKWIVGPPDVIMHNTGKPNDNHERSLG